jgi:hypothetical protein
LPPHLGAVEAVRRIFRTTPGRRSGDSSLGRKFSQRETPLQRFWRHCTKEALVKPKNVWKSKPVI